MFKVKEHRVNINVGMLYPMHEKYYYCIYYLVLVHFIIYLMLKLEGSHDGQLSPVLQLDWQVFGRELDADFFGI